jgi:hypothetical protein
MQIPGGWVSGPLHHVHDQQLGEFTGRDARVAYMAVTSQVSSPTNLENEIWTRNLIGPTWSVGDFQLAYDKKQSWLSYFLCYEMVAIRPVPVFTPSCMLNIASY